MALNSWFHRWFHPGPSVAWGDAMDGMMAAWYMESHSHVVFLQSKVIVMDLAAAKNRVSHVSQASNPSSKTS